MTVSAWIIFVALALVFLVGFPVAGFIFGDGEKAGAVAGLLIGVGLSIGLFFGMRWYYSSTAAGQRAVIDEKSNLGNGIDRVVTVYTADGSIIAQYEGKIDLDANDGGYVKFDFDGKRYIYYNCFVESIAVIDSGD